jgi:hypothetical protein
MEDGATIITELDAALAMIRTGLVALGVNPRNLDAAMQQLAPGYERFLKLTFILAEAHLQGSRPAWGALKAHGHDLLGLLDALLGSVAKIDGYASKPAAAEDLRFMRADSGMRALLEVLSHFGKYGRYARIDDLVRDERVGADGDPSRRWEEIEQELIWARPDSEEIAESMDLLPPATFEVRAALRRLARALGRMWVFGALGEEGAAHLAVLSQFTRLNDDELGARAGG